MNCIYNDIISPENLLIAWKEFLKGKRHKKDVQEFQLRLMDNIFALHDDLKQQAYRHGKYTAFNISDPKPRNIHKASVRDRLLHHAVYRVLYPYFENKFIYDSYSCRDFKGTHKALERFKYFSRKVSKNNTKQCFVLKCDIRKFFASIDHGVLSRILNNHIEDRKTVELLEEVIGSFETASGKGLPLGNLTSQLLVNIYMNEFDHFVKQELKIKYYIRYADDFVVLSNSKEYLIENLFKMLFFLQKNLNLSLHPEKVFIKTISSGVDFLGWVHFPKHRVLRTSTKRRVIKRMKQVNGKYEVLVSYLGLLSHGNGVKLRVKLLNVYLFSNPLTTNY